MRIKKVSQIAGTVGSIVNSYSTSSNDSYSSSYVNGLNTYSTTETRIGTWIDGKPLYRRVVELPNELTISASDWAGTSLPSNNIATIINGLGIKSGDATSQIRVQASTDALSIMNPASSFSIVIKYIIIEYTKTTD